jgi:hypothetical protein
VSAASEVRGQLSLSSTSPLRGSCAAVLARVGNEVALDVSAERATDAKAHRCAGAAVAAPVLAANGGAMCLAGVDRRLPSRAHRVELVELHRDRDDERLDSLWRRLAHSLRADEWKDHPVSLLGTGLAVEGNPAVAAAQLVGLSPGALHAIHPYRIVETDENAHRAGRRSSGWRDAHICVLVSSSRGRWRRGERRATRDQQQERFPSHLAVLPRRRCRVQRDLGNAGELGASFRRAASLPRSQRARAAPAARPAQR